MASLLESLPTRGSLFRDIMLNIVVLLTAIVVSGLATRWTIEVSRLRALYAALLGGVLDSLKYVELLLIVIVSTRLAITAVAGGMMGTFIVVKLEERARASC